MLGVLAVGIAALMLISSLSTSIENTMNENVHDLLSSDIILTPGGENGEDMIVDVDTTMAHIQELQGGAPAGPGSAVRAWG